jgi:uncharacterized protein (DUF1800 family)
VLALIVLAWSVLAGAARAGAGPSFEEAVRFLEQATFGPTPALIARVQEIGFAGFLDEQLARPAPALPDLGDWPSVPPDDCDRTCRRDHYSMYPLQVGAYRAFITSDDQLRLRVAFALNQIFVVSAVDGALRLPSRMLPYLQVLASGAFGNFRQLLTDITLNPAMGSYLDTAGNRAAAPNENYARELLQLFTIGVDELNPDGTPRLDPSEQRIASYDQATVTAFARVFTGWVLAPARTAGAPNYFDPLVAGNASAHDREAKALLNGVILPAGQDAAADLRNALDNVFAHPNVGPFIGKRLIQHLVTSNPSPAFVGRVAGVFRSTGGNLAAVVRAILLDPEARADPRENPAGGHLREPVLWVSAFLRAFGPRVVTDYVLADSFLPGALQMGQDLFRSPSVFNFYPPDHVVAGEAVLGPEFAIYSTSTALGRANFAYRVVYGTMPTGQDRPTGTALDLAGLEPVASDPVALVDTLTAFGVHGGISPEGRAAIIASVAAIPPTDPLGRLREAVYLLVTSPQYLVQR